MTEPPVTLDQTVAGVDFEGGGHFPGTCPNCGCAPGEPMTLTAPPFELPPMFKRTPCLGTNKATCCHVFHSAPGDEIFECPECQDDRSIFPYPDLERPSDINWAIIAGLLSISASALALLAVVIAYAR